MDVSLQPVTGRNFAAVIGLQVAPEQRGFVRANPVSLAECTVEPTWAPLAICAAETPVGFAVTGQHEPSGRWCIMVLMIGAEHQGKGYRTAALGQRVSLMVARHAVRERGGRRQHHRPAGGGLWALGSGLWALGSERWAMSRELRAFSQSHGNMPLRKAPRDVLPKAQSPEPVAHSP